jgi:hypothetical protein
MTKEEANYKEVHFCSFCTYFQFRYGDYYCTKLDVPVAESGSCDLYEKDGKPTPEKPIVIRSTNCTDCDYNMDGMCGKTGELAKKKSCAQHSSMEYKLCEGVSLDAVIKLVEDSVNDVEEADIFYESFDAERPLTSEELTIIDPDTYKVVKECTTCADAYYDNNGIAMCRRFNQRLDMSDLTACIEYNEDQEVSNDVSIEDSN